MSQVRRLWKWVWRLSLAGLVLLLGTIVAVRLYLTDARITKIAQDQLKKHVPFPVTFSGVELSLLHGIVIKDLDVGAPNAHYEKHPFKAKEIQVGYKLGPLANGTLQIDTICIIEPVATLEEKQGKWNVVAMGEAFPPSTEAPKPKDDSPPADLPVEITLARFCVDNMTADVFGEKMNAHLDHFFVEARGSYRGITQAEGEVELDLGRADAPSGITFAQEGLGNIALESRSRITTKLADLKHVAAAWNLGFTLSGGEMSGFAVPQTPVALTGSATVDLDKELAAVPALGFTMGEAVKFSTAVNASDILHDPMITVRSTSLAVDLATVTSWLPSDTLPAKMRGKFIVDKLDLDGRQSALTAQQGFALELSTKLEALAVKHEAAAFERASMSLAVTTQPEDDVKVQLRMALPQVVSDAAVVDQITVSMDVEGPHQLLLQKLPKPLKVSGEVTVGEVRTTAAEGPKTTLHSTKLAFSADTLDLAGNVLNALVDLSITKVQSVVPKQGTFAFPVTAHAAVHRQGPRFRFDGTTLSVGDWFDLAVDGRVELKANGAMDCDVKVAMADIVLQKMLASLPRETRALLDGRSLEGKVGANLHVFGHIPADVAKRFEGEPIDLAFAGTPFAVDAALRFSDLDVVDQAAKVQKGKGEFTLSTRPNNLSIAMAFDAAGVQASEADLSDLVMRGKVKLLNDEGHVEFTQSTSSIAYPVLAMPLTKQSLSTKLTYVRGGDATLESFIVNLPSLAAVLKAKGMIGEIDDVIEEERFADKTLAGIKAEFSSQLDLSAPSNAKLLKGNEMAISGHVGFGIEVGIKDGRIDLSGAMTAKDFSFEQPATRVEQADGKPAVDQPATLVRQMTGRVPFTQSLRLNERGEPIYLWSDVDILKDNPRIAYYEELRSYRGEAYGLSIAELKSGTNVISGIDVHGRWDRGAFYVDHYSMSLLNGDISGTLGVALGNDKIARVSLASTFSNLDLSVMAKTPPGPDSQLSGTMTLGVAWGEKNQNVDASFNLTRLGRDVLVQGLLALDPEEKNKDTTANRKLIERTAIKINLLEATVRRNTLKAKLYYSFLLTTLSLGLYKPVPNVLLGEDGLAIQSYIQAQAPKMSFLAPLLGWSTPAQGTQK